MDVLIRPEIQDDFLVIKAVNDAAFGKESESRLIERLREHPDFIPDLSLVAEKGERIVGYILFFPVAIVNKEARVPALALAPMAVVPGFQKQGIGGELIHEGLVRAWHEGFDIVVVLGHPGYYPRFGFVEASAYGIKPPFEAPKEAFMVLTQRLGVLDGVHGMVEYPPPYLES